jgi:hypothetical protein
MVNDTSFSDEIKIDSVMDENSTIGALKNMIFISNELDGYDTIDFSLLDDGYSEIPEENTFIMEQQSTENAAEEAIFESTVPFEDMKKSDLFLHGEIIEALTTVFNDKHLIEEVAHGFYDLEAEHNGLVRLWNIQETRRKNVFVRSDKPLVDTMLGTHNNNTSIENARYSNVFVPVLNLSKRTFEKYSGEVESNRHDSSDNAFPIFSTTENYGMLRDHLKKGEDNAYKNLDSAGISIQFSDNRPFPNMLFDTDVFLVNTYQAYQIGTNVSHRFSNGIKRIIIQPTTSRDNVVFEKDDIVVPEKKKVSGFVEKLGKSKNVKVYNLSLDKLEKIDRTHKGTNAYIFSNSVTNDVQSYAKIMEYVVPSLSDMVNGANNLLKFSKNIKKYDYNVTNITPLVFKSLQEKFGNAVSKVHKNKFSKLGYSAIPQKMVMSNENDQLLFNDERLAFLENYYGSYKKEYKKLDNSLMRFAWYASKSDNGSLLIDINSDKRRREINSLTAKEQQKKYSLYSKYFINMKQNILSKIILSTSDEVQQKELCKRYLSEHGIISKMSHSVIDRQGNYICCSHTYDLLFENIDIEGLLMVYGINYRGGYSCKYCGENLHTNYDEGPSFDDDGNLIVSHGEIEIEEPITVVTNEHNDFIDQIFPAIVAATSIKYTDVKINKSEVVKMFLKNFKNHLNAKPYLNDIFSIDAVEQELKKEKENTLKVLKNAAQRQNKKLPTNIDNNVSTEINITYITSLVCYKIAVLMSVFMLQLQLSNPMLFGDENIYASSFVSISSQPSLLTVIANYISEKFYAVLPGKLSYEDFITKKNIVPVPPFTSVVRQTKNITMMHSVLEDNYKGLLQTEKVDIILAKHSLKNNNVVKMHHNISHYGSIKVSDSSSFYEEKNMRILASDYVKEIDEKFKNEAYSVLTDYDLALRLSVDINSMLDNNEPRKNFETTKTYDKTLENLAENIAVAKKNMEQKSALLKSTFVKNVRNDVVPSKINFKLDKNTNYKTKVISARKITVKNVTDENTECSGSKNALNNIMTIAVFISENMLLENEEVRELEFVKYWYPNSSFNKDGFVNLYSSSLLAMSDKKVAELTHDIVFSDSMKNRKYSDFYMKEMYRELNTIFTSSMNYFLENYLRQSVVFFSKEILDEETTFSINDAGFASYKHVEAEEGETTLCVMLREMVHNIGLLSGNGMQFKYALLLLKVAYDIMLNINSKNSTNAEIDSMHFESKRKQYMNMKKAKERDEIMFENKENEEQENNVAPEEQNTDKVAVAIVGDEETEGNYASM